jgi:metal-dependent HD superfamily phosphatase/phosphodiesterase
MKNIHNQQGQNHPGPSEESGGKGKGQQGVDKSPGNERIPQNEEEADVESTQSISLEQQELFKGKKVDEDIEAEEDLPMEQPDL